MPVANGMDIVTNDKECTESRKAALEEEQLLIYKSKDKKLANRYLNEYAESKGKMLEVNYQIFTIYQLF